MRGWLLTAMLTLVPVAALAQSLQEPGPALLWRAPTDLFSVGVGSRSTLRIEWTPDGERPASPLMMSMYAATVMVQALDVHSTFAALDAGARESNPLIKGLVSHRAAFVLVKAGMTAGTIYATHRLARHSRLHAILALAAIDAVYVAIIVHNYRVAARMTRTGGAVVAAPPVAHSRLGWSEF